MLLGPLLGKQKSDGADASVPLLPRSLPVAPVRARLLLLNQALLGPRAVLMPPLALQLGALWGWGPRLIQPPNPPTLRQGPAGAGLSKRSRAQGLARVGKQNHTELWSARRPS